MIKHIRTAAVSAVLILSLLLSGCGIIIIEDLTGMPETSDPPSDTDAPVSGGATANPFTVIANADALSSAADAYLSHIPVKDYEGSPYIITVPWTNVISPAEDGTVLSAAKEERNRKVEERWNVSIVASAVDTDSFTTLLQASVQADEYYSDLLMIPQYMLGSFVANDSLINLHSLPFLDLERPYFDAASAEAATVGRATYAVAGAGSFEESTLTAAFFNRGLFQQLGLDLPYKDVYEGRWTWDRFFEITALVSDINAQSDIAYASFSTQYAAEQLPGTVFFSAGGRFVRSDGINAPVLAYSEEDASVAERLTALFGDKNAHGDIDSGVTKFYTGESLFLLDRLYLMTWMPNGKQNWGVLPLPKHSAEQENHITLVSDEALFFASQKNTLDAERTAIILSAMNAASYGVISDAYITHSMHHIIRDNDTANMLDVIIKSRTYDFSLSFEQTNSTLSSAALIGMREVADGDKTFQNLCSRINTVNKQLATKYPAG